MASAFCRRDPKMIGISDVGQCWLAIVAIARLYIG